MRTTEGTCPGWMGDQYAAESGHHRTFDDWFLDHHPPQPHDRIVEPGGIDQVGCIYTAQGFEFDYAGVIFGNDLVYRPREGWVGRKEFSHDGGLKRGTSDEDFTRLVKNTYRVLLSRGLKGCYVHFTDDKTRGFVESRIDQLALQLAAEQPADYDGGDR